MVVEGPNYHQQAKNHLIWIFRMIDTGWITPAIKPEIMSALDKLEKVDMNSEVNYNAR